MDSMLSTFDRATEALLESNDTSRNPDRAETIATLKEIQSWYDASPKLQASDDTSSFLSPPMLLPICGGVAYGEGSLVLSPERSVTVHLGGEYFAQMSPADAAGVLERRAATELAERTANDIMIDTASVPPSVEKKHTAPKSSKCAPADAAKSAKSSAAAFARAMERGFSASSSSDAKSNAGSTLETSSVPDAASAQSPPTLTPEMNRPTRVEIQEESDDSENDEDGFEEGGDDYEDDEDFDEHLELSEDGLFEIEEQVDEYGRELTAKAVNMQSKIHATEGFRNLLVNASKEKEDGNHNASSASIKQAATAAALSLQGRSALPKEAKQRKRSGQPSGAKSKTADKVPYVETVKALEALMAAEEAAASEERDASEAARVQGITSPAWSKGFFSKSSPPAMSTHGHGSTDRPQPAVVAPSGGEGNCSSNHNIRSRSAPVASNLPETSALRSTGPTVAGKSEQPPSRVAPVGLPQPIDKTPLSQAPAVMQDRRTQDTFMPSASEQPEEQKPISKFKREQLARRERDSQRSS